MTAKTATKNEISNLK